MPDAMDHLQSLFEQHFGMPPQSVTRMPADASSRRYVRMLGAGGQRAIGAVGPDREENRAFLGYSKALHDAGLRVPELFAADESEGVWIMEDLGDTTLYAALGAARDRTGSDFPDELAPVFGRVLEELVRLQVEGARVVDFALAYPRSDFDAYAVRWDLNYFKYHFLRLAHVPFNEDRLERDFEALTDFVLEAESGYFVHRDFQPRNIMLRDGEPWFIDYQGGRRGALQYDVASLLYSGSGALPGDVRERLLHQYLEALAERIQVDRDQWIRHYRGFSLLRVLQALGAYGYRGFFENRPAFVARVPTAARSLAELAEIGIPVELPELADAIERIVRRWGDASLHMADAPSDQPFHVRLSSFSYRRGYPEDAGGHGGGFVFDCRALPNPGREPDYAYLTGLDESVVGYLEADEHVHAFWEGCRLLVDAQVENYLARGFDSLSVAFGCTGGQHRSVYCVERTARHLRSRFPGATVEVDHRETERWPSDPSGLGSPDGSA